MIQLTKWNRQTAEVLAAMFTENTGVHFLDSGMVNGRQWQRLAGKTLEDFIAAPSTTINWKYECYSINAFQWLLANLTYDPLMQRRFELIVGTTDDPHLVDIETFTDVIHDGTQYPAEGKEPTTFNSYNGETLLDSTIQGSIFSWQGQVYIALQIHGGADVRGGYTAPKMFSIDDADYWWDETIEFYCTNEECKDGYDNYPWGASLNLTEWVTHDGSFVKDPWEDSEYKKEEGQCPACGKELSTEARLQH